jgi:hypothetical protein
VSELENHGLASFHLVGGEIKMHRLNFKMTTKDPK